MINGKAGLDVCRSAVAPETYIAYTWTAAMQFDVGEVPDCIVIGSKNAGDI